MNRKDSALDEGYVPHADDFRPLPPAEPGAEQRFIEAVRKAQAEAADRGAS